MSKNCELCHRAKADMGFIAVYKSQVITADICMVCWAQFLDDGEVCEALMKGRTASGRIECPQDH